MEEYTNTRIFRRKNNDNILSPELRKMNYYNTNNYCNIKENDNINHCISDILANLSYLTYICKIHIKSSCFSLIILNIISPILYFNIFKSFSFIFYFNSSIQILLLLILLLSCLPWYYDTIVIINYLFGNIYHSHSIKHLIYLVSEIDNKNKNNDENNNINYTAFDKHINNDKDKINKTNNIYKNKYFYYYIIPIYISKIYIIYYGLFLIFLSFFTIFLIDISFYDNIFFLLAIILHSFIYISCLVYIYKLLYQLSFNYQIMSVIYTRINSKNKYF